jgi:hypothetical protein
MHKRLPFLNKEVKVEFDLSHHHTILYRFDDSWVKATHQLFVDGGLLYKESHEAVLLFKVHRGQYAFDVEGIDCLFVYKDTENVNAALYIGGQLIDLIDNKGFFF